MYVSTEKTVTIDDVELSDIIVKHLRGEGLLPEGQKIHAIIISGAMDVGLKTKTTEGVPLIKPIRALVKWHPNAG